MNAIEIKGLTKSYPGFVLGPLDLTLPRGCILGLVGENGAGKSTTMRLMLNILEPEQGSITILGRDHQKEALPIREELGVVPDEVGIPGCLTARQFGKILGGTYRNWEPQTYEALLSRLNVPRDKEFRALSKGMKMKLGICAAMSHGAKLLLLDEATSGLDPVARDEVLDLLNDFTRREDCSVLLSSHIVSDLEKCCDYIAFLHKGKRMLLEEKDRLKEEYGIALCNAAQLEALPREAVIHSKRTPYGAEAIVKRSLVPGNLEVHPVTIEDLFVSMVKEG